MVNRDMGGASVELAIEGLRRFNLALKDRAEDVAVENNIKGNEILDNELVGKDVFLHAFVVSAELQEGMTKDEWVYEIHIPSIDLNFAGAKQEHFTTDLHDLVEMQRDRIEKEIHHLSRQIQSLNSDLLDLRDLS